MTENPVLIIIDVQKAIDSPYHAAEGPRNNPEAEKNIACLLTAWRKANLPILHIRHDSTFATSDYRPGQAGNHFKAEVQPWPNETIIAKKTNSAFIGTDLEKYLRRNDLNYLVVAGVSTNNSVEATVRMGGNLGFTICLIEDACFTFARRDYQGTLRSAQEVHAMSLANLKDEYCSILKTTEMLEKLELEYHNLMS